MYLYPKDTLYPNIALQTETIYPGLATNTLNQYEIEENIFYEYLTDKLDRKYLYNAYSAIRAIDYTPFETLETFGLPFLEVGDIVSVDVYEGEITESVSKDFPVLTRTLKGIQSLTDNIKANGKEYINKENYI